MPDNVPNGSKAGSRLRFAQLNILLRIVCVYEVSILRMAIAIIQILLLTRIGIGAARDVSDKAELGPDQDPSKRTETQQQRETPGRVARVRTLDSHVTLACISHRAAP